MEPTTHANKHEMGKIYGLALILYVQLSTNVRQINHTRSKKLISN